MGYFVNQGGNRDINVNNTNLVTVANGIFMSNDQTARQLNHNMTLGGNLVVDGPLYNTLHSGGITTQKAAGGSATTMVNGTARFQGTGTTTLNADSSGTFVGSEVRANSPAPRSSWATTTRWATAPRLSISTAAARLI